MIWNMGEDFGGFASFSDSFSFEHSSNFLPKEEKKDHVCDQDSWNNAFDNDSQIQKRNSLSLQYETSIEVLSVFGNKQFNKQSLQNEEKCKKNVAELDSNVASSKVFQELVSNDHHDPVKFKDTTYYEFKIENILQLFHLSSQTSESEPSYHSFSSIKFGCYRDNFNFHKINGPKKEHLSSKISFSSSYNSINHLPVVTVASQETQKYSKRQSVQNGNIPDVKERKEQCEQKMPIPSNVNKYTGKSTQELKNLIADIENQINSYSESLLIELDLREKYKREKEIKNNFIASYIAVEAKLNQYKRKKAGFFKYSDDSARNSPISIPYFENGNGISVDDIHSMTKILQAMEKDDAEVSRLIAEYIINVGENHDLETVIQIRSEDGVVTPISSPKKSKVNVER